MEPVPVPNQACFCNDDKSQGQTQKSGTLARGGYIHSWQLYVAVSRVADPQHLHFAVSNGISRKTRNVVYKELL